MLNLQGKYIPLHPYQIYDASAGSGKTFTLVKEYLKLILIREGHQDFRKILAITFTNKAVNEMKQRILSSLLLFASNEEEEQNDLFQQLVEELEIDPKSLRFRAKQVLKAILHNYAFFDISTIDKFNHRLLKTFARDLKLPQTFEVVLDTDLLLSEGIDRLLGNAKTNDQLTNLLIAFAMQKVDDSKSWDISFDLTKVGKMLFNENHLAYLEDLKVKELKTFLLLQRDLRHLLEMYPDKMRATAGNILSLIDEAGLEEGDFNRGSFPKFIQKAYQDPETLDFSSGWKQNFGSESLYPKKTADDKKQAIDRLMPRFTELWEQLKADFGRYSFLKNVYNNLVPLTLLNALQKEIDILLEEREQLPISAFNTLIGEQIRDQPTPFIYERLGEKYRHYFIDEFQDTSLKQWHNLVPLISHALQGEDLQGNRGSLFLVGDAKQAIYRWRGGRSELFLNLIHKDDTLFGISPKTASLKTNFRSYEEIVSFNNGFFTSVVPYLNNELYRTLFLEGNKQQHTAKEGGVVSLRFISDQEEDKTLAYCSQVYKCIADLRAKDVPYGEICVLFRSNKQGVHLAEHLIKNQIPIISSDALLLESNQEVRFLINLLKYSSRTSDLNIQFDLLFHLSPEKGRHQFISNHLGKLPAFFNAKYQFSLSDFNQRSVYDALEYAIERFHLVGNSHAYISSLLDEVLEVELQRDSGFSSFLSVWEKNKSKWSIPAPENMDAVQLMTIHKAKGLEFPFVIFPFADSNIYEDRGTNLWVPALDEALKGFDHILVRKRKDMTLYNEESEIIYEEELHKMELDAFNILYVALTRGIQGVYIISEMALNKKGESKSTHYSGLFINYLRDLGIWDAAKYQYDFGELIYGKSNCALTFKEEDIPYIYTTKFEGKLEISTSAGELWGSSRELAISQGNLLHYGMSTIETLEDIDAAVANLINNGAIVASESNSYRELFSSIVHHPLLSRFFSAGNKVKNEKSVFAENGVILRPDRMVFNENKVSILDYKTGDQKTSHVNQLNSYGDVLNSMGYTVEHKVLIYVEDHIKPIFI
ncbi:UvrD-helicase domain-containing protein [Muriicola soli]|uniref:DNA 3'-5' helicase n=1 Tax=Muriicola soli TaxID=2507538 RepID=A0A411ECB6_9FLAO|nr:UvrD-helicase domain-containing protein [Muriicola soli]QBA65268.1 ATP-dependent helicase [Muriicola soli]